MILLNHIIQNTIQGRLSGAPARVFVLYEVPVMAAKLPTVPNLDPSSNLTRYLQEIRKFPVLAAEEEFMLAITGALWYDFA